MNQISALPNPLEILFQEYNQGRIESVGFRSFTLHTGESNSYRTLKSALIVPVSGRAIFSFEHEPFIAKRGLFLHGCPDKTLTISALGEQDFHYINMYYENDRPLLFSPQAQKSGTDLFHSGADPKAPPGRGHPQPVPARKADGRILRPDFRRFSARGNLQ